MKYVSDKSCRENQNSCFRLSNFFCRLWDNVEKYCRGAGHRRHGTCTLHAGYLKRPYTLSDKLSDYTVWRHTWQKNWVKCAVLTGNSAGLRTVLSSRLSHTELHSSLRESQSFFCFPADTTMASSQGTSVSSNSFSRWASHDTLLFKYHFLLHILRFLFFFSDTIMADVASKQ